MQITICKRLFTALSTLFAFVQLQGQGIVVLRGTNPSDSIYDDFRQFDSLTNKAKLIGFGEATHGTHEFSTIRHRYFKYLVKEKNFNTFFLEADYALCLDINRFVHGEYDTSRVDSLLLAVRLWPWITQEMKEFILWMRNYNRDTKTKKIDFVGVDMQFMKNNFFKLKKLFQKYELQWPQDNFIEYNEIDSHNKGFNTYTKSKKDSLNAFIKMVGEIDFGTTIAGADKLVLKYLLKTLHQKANNSNESPSYRDSCMAVNIISYIKDNTMCKGLYWAHNGHIVNGRDLYYNKKSTGNYLKTNFGEEYISIGQDFYKGSFNAYTNKNGNWVFSTFKSGKPPKGSLARELNKFEHDVFLIDTRNFKGNLSVSSIGAEYGKSLTGVAYFRYTGYLTANFFDLIVFTKYTTPTQVLMR